MDKQGRLNISSDLRRHAHIDKEVVSIGVDSRVEIWSKADWESYNESPELDSELIAEKWKVWEFKYGIFTCICAL